jgi:hypothetical protein
MNDDLKATVVSLFPLPINEPKPGLYPGYFAIPAAPLGDTVLLGHWGFHVLHGNSQ